ncbi:molybdopterin-guanine dinucleotide biosynthesis protein B [Mesorhizobium sp. CAU 1732]|uniref:molybdopterin-guanine dinucleotide biosynthesis protein B n=1 Tax=Mesorhizobium sp. CAU 1732 TaxID=3140358 RepID=UPI003260D139
MRLYGVVGWKNTGKTGLVERLVTEMVGRGVAVSTVKHAHKGFDIDHPGRDSDRHRQAGATEVLISSPARWALIHERRGEPELQLDELLPKFSPVDLVLVEGFKRSGLPRVETYRAEVGKPLLVLDDPTIRAVASDTPHAGLQVPLFDLNDTAGIAEFILREVGL